MLIALRRKVAGWFGHKEHTAGRLLGVLAVVDFFLHKDLVSGAILITWLVYIVSHTLEKKSYGKYGFR